jgi:hypothetical protein
MAACQVENRYVTLNALSAQKPALMLIRSLNHSAFCDTFILEKRLLSL